MRYIIVDLEATCWRSGVSRDRMEIIEIGAVALASCDGPVVDTFETCVQPVVERRLSDFCRTLTGIGQEEVDAAETFAFAFRRFLDWIGAEPYRLCSWGAYDLGQFRQDCARHNVAVPDAFENHLNLKRAFSRLEGTKPMGMAGALAYLKLTLEGRHHRGGDDAKNIARIALHLLPRIEAEEMER